jgi:predicted nucleic acid-binding protein
MTLYPDASAWAKQYVAEHGRDDTIGWFRSAALVVCSRIGYVETYRAVQLAADRQLPGSLEAFGVAWEAVEVVELDDAVMRRSAALAAMLRLRSMDAVHLASAETVASPELAFATWDRRLWRAAKALGLTVLPETEP